MRKLVQNIPGTSNIRMQGVMFSNPHYRHYVNILVVIFTCWLHTRVSRGGGGVRLGGGAGQGGDSSTPDSPGVRREEGGPSHPTNKYRAQCEDCCHWTQPGLIDTSRPLTDLSQPLCCKEAVYNNCRRSHYKVIPTLANVLLWLECMNIVTIKINISTTTLL